MRISKRLLLQTKPITDNFGKAEETGVQKFVRSFQIVTLKDEQYFLDEKVPETLPGLVSSPQPNDTYSDYLNILRNTDKEKSDMKMKHLRMEQLFSTTYCMKMSQEFKGKFFISPLNLINKKQSKYIPHLRAKDFDGETVNLEDSLKGKISVILFQPNVDVSRKWGETWFKNGKNGENFLTTPESFDEHNQILKDDLEKLSYKDIIGKYRTSNSRFSSGNISNIPFKKNKNFKLLKSQIIQVNSINSTAQKFINYVMEKKLKKNVPEDYKSNFFTVDLQKQLPFYLKYNLNLYNPFAPIVLVVDENLKIRWTGSGVAQNAKEAEFLWDLVNDLRLKELS
ncbi:hypothetical protein QEN19_002673 [Hanseniaspora menglaensis]